MGWMMSLCRATEHEWMLNDVVEPETNVSDTRDTDESKRPIMLR